MSSNHWKEQFEKDGYAVIEDFLSSKEIQELKEAGKIFIKNATDNPKKSIFSTINQHQRSDCYFIESADKISYFFELDVLDENGALKVNPEFSLNKVGHALHWLHSSFKKITFSDKVKDVCKQLNMQVPLVVQSMYIYKNPKTGSEVKAHQDSSFLYTEPDQLYGFWFAIDDATVDNGCLSFIPGSHTDEVHCRFIRNPDKKSTVLCKLTESTKVYEDSEFRLTPVKKGSCVLIHGRVVHRSSANLSNKSREAYTFHIYDSHGCTYSTENWLQTNFHALYEN